MKYGLLFSLFCFSLTLLYCSRSEGAYVEVRCDDAQNIEPPKSLSQTCLYINLSTYSVSPQLHQFTPNYQLWSDGAEKLRWIYLPKNTQINTDDPDRWKFPLGTQFFKEFRKQVLQEDGSFMEIKVETRHLKKIHPADGIESWSIATYAWLSNQQDAVLSTGEKNALGTGHNIPTEKECVMCHKGNVDGILGFDAIQLSDLQAKYAFGHGPKRTLFQWSLQTLLHKNLITTPIDQPTLPGTPLEQKTLGYLHANCGNCHNPLGHADQDAKHLQLRHKVSFQSIEGTDVYHTAVNKPTQNFTSVPYIIMGAEQEEMALYQSALFLRMNSLDGDYRMPMLASSQVDYSALQLMHQWLLTLPTPENFRFNRDNSARRDNDSDSPQLSQLQPLQALKTEEPGLHIQIQFSSVDVIPKVMLIYWSEDYGLDTNPIMDHKEGLFTRGLIIGNKGNVMSLRNSDDVGHTIYVKDTRQDIHWQLNYMPPGSRFEQELFWKNDTFVEMRCRLHLYMSAWAGSISSRYYKIIDFNEGDLYKSIRMTGYPDKYSKLTLWLPGNPPLHIQIDNGETKKIEINQYGTLLLQRFRQSIIPNSQSD